jgi:hypothetical protein
VLGVIASATAVAAPKIAPLGEQQVVVHDFLNQPTPGQRFLLCEYTFTKVLNM